jgi:hypothetical protein
MIYKELGGNDAVFIIVVGVLSDVKGLSSGEI